MPSMIAPAGLNSFGPVIDDPNRTIYDWPNQHPDNRRPKPVFRDRPERTDCDTAEQSRKGITQHNVPRRDLAIRILRGSAKDRHQAHEEGKDERDC